MRRGVGDLLMWAGAAVGALDALLLVLGAWVHLPPALVIAIAKALPFLVAVALLALGAVTRRQARRIAELRALGTRSQALLDGIDGAHDGAPMRTAVRTPVGTPTHDRAPS